jgi:methionyl aminopeptidase
MADINDMENIVNDIDFTKHPYSDWKIDYVPNNNLYRIDDEDIDNAVFVRGDKDGAYDEYDDYRKASIVHKLARNVARQYLVKDGKLSDLVDNVEATILKMTKQNPETYYREGCPKDNFSGIAFPVAVNINNIVAHDTKLVTVCDDRTFAYGDVVKINIGVHVNGRIIDSAFTHIISDEPGVSDDSSIYMPLIEASTDAMFSAIKMSGPDALLVEISEIIDEVIGSYEIDNKGINVPIRPVHNIGGHSMDVNVEHGEKMIFCSPNPNVQLKDRMVEGEIYAMGAYASTGIGNATHNMDDADMNCTHFMINDALADTASKKEIKHFRKSSLYKWAKKRKGLTFSTAWLYDKIKYTDYGMLQTQPFLNKLNKSFNLGIQSEQMLAYPPVMDEKHSRVSHFQHTIRIGDKCVEIFSLGNDY